MFPRPTFFKARKGEPIEAYGGIYEVAWEIGRGVALLEEAGKGHLRRKERREALAELRRSS